MILDFRFGRVRMCRTAKPRSAMPKVGSHENTKTRKHEKNDIMLFTRTCLLICCAAPFGLLAQNALEDALALRAFIDNTYKPNGETKAKFREDCAECPSILWRYSGEKSKVIDEVALFDAFEGNPFIGKREREVKVLYPQVFNAAGNRTGAALVATPAAPLPSTSGLFVNNIADGLAKFLVVRTKEELSIAFFSRLQRDLRENTRLQTLFPASAGTLNTIDNDIYRFNLYLQGLRQSFTQDLKTLPTNLQRAVDQEGLIKRPEYRVALSDVLSLSQLLLDRKSPDSVFRYLAFDASLQTRKDLIGEVASPQTKRQLENLANSFRFGYVLSESLRSAVPGTIWHGGERLREALRDSVTLHLYLGLLWQQSKGIQFEAGSKTINVQQALTQAGRSATELMALKTFLHGFADKSQRTSTDMAQAKGPGAKGEGGYEKVYTFFNSFFGLLQHTVTFKDVIAAHDSTDQFESTYLRTLRNLNDMNFNIRQKAYSSAVVNLSAVLADLASENQDLRKKVLRYGNFMAAVAESETSDQVAAAIDAIALPPGSSILKKRTAVSVALNAYTGLAVGRERLMDSNVEDSGFAGVSAPVGLTISKGFGQSGSLSLLVPIIDVGALVAFRFRDENAALLPKLTWSNIVSPGAYLAYGFFNDLPITLGVGAQLGPNLREVGPTLEQQASGWRWGGFISVDIPIFNLYAH